MKILHSWLQDFIDEKLPRAEDLAHRITMRSFEVEGIEYHGEDAVLDIDVLPNRRHDCLSHLGVAREVAAILSATLTRDPVRASEHELLPQTEQISISLEDDRFSPRYSAALVEGVVVGPSPDWLTKRLEALGQHSVNNVVDATNYVMFMLGQPLHAFDAEKLSRDEKGMYSLGVRSARAGENITTLDEETHALSEGDLLIVDRVSGTPIGLAGIKGGKQSGITEATETIIVESANFDPVAIRKTATRLGLRTDASLRFEAGLTPELTAPALQEVVSLIQHIAKGELVGMNDAYPNTHTVPEITVTNTATESIIGVSVGNARSLEILSTLGFGCKETDSEIRVSPPADRLDIRIPEDVIEEISRFVDYTSSASSDLEDPESSPPINSYHYYAEQVRERLTALGYSEVLTYTFVPAPSRKKADTMVALTNPLAEDKRYLRDTLFYGLNKSLELNQYNAPLLGEDTIRIFEIGTVFTQEEEYVALGIATNSKKADQELTAVEDELQKLLGVSLDGKKRDGILELNFSACVERLPTPGTYEAYAESTPVTFRPISAYPFVLRDVAVWVPEDTDVETVRSVIREEAGDLLVRDRLFDTFPKEGRVSYAFRLVFQSHEKTLTDEEVNAIMEQIYKTLSTQEGWEIR